MTPRPQHHPATRATAHRGVAAVRRGRCCSWSCRPRWGWPSRGSTPSSRGPSPHSAATTWSPSSLAAPVLAVVAMLASRRRRAAPRCWCGWGCCTTASTTTPTTRSARPSASAFLLHVAALVASIGGLLMLADEHRRRRASPAASRRHPRAGGRRLHHGRRGGAASRRGAGCRCASPSTGTLPANVMPPSAVHLVYAIDLSLLAPVFVVAGVLLWRREAWGSVLAVAINASGAVVPGRAVGGRRVPVGCRHPGHDVGVTGGDRVGARVPRRDAGAARAPARRGRAGGCSVGRRPRRHLTWPPSRRPRRGLSRPATPRRRRRASRAGCRPSTSRASVPWPRSTSPAPGGRRAATRTA